MNFNKDTDVNESRFADIRAYQTIDTPDVVYQLLGELIVLDRYTNIEMYDELFERVVDVAVCCWNIPIHNDVMQHTSIHFKVSIDDTMTHALPLNRFMTSMTFIRTILPYIDSVNIEDFILHKFMSEKDREHIQDNIVKVLRGRGNSNFQIQETMAYMSLQLKQLTAIFSQADLQIFSAENLFLDHYMESEVIRNINDTEYPPNTQTIDIVAQNAEKYRILEEEMTKRGNPFFIDSKYAKIVKPKQMEELYINFSQIPDGRDIIPVIMNGNGFKAGYHEKPVFYAASIAAKVPDLMNERWMGDSGYFNRNMMMLTYGTISKTVYDCGSRNPIPMTVDDTVLNMMHGRFYMKNKNDGILHVLSKSDRHLIGKRLWFRSPCTCNLNEDCCHVCYGTIATRVGDLEGGFIYTTELMTSRVSQNILSAKHLLKTDAERIEFTNNWDKWLQMYSSNIYPTDEKRFNIMIREDYHDNITESLTFYMGKDMEEVTVSNYADIHIPQIILDKMKKVEIDDVTYLQTTNFKVAESGGALCEITPVNISVISKYMDIIKFFNSGIAKFDTIEDCVLRLMNMLHGLIPIFSVHGEIIIGHLLKNPENRMLRPNWLNPDEPYQIVTVKTALDNSESAMTAVAFEKTSDQLLRAVFDNRNEINRVGVRSFSDFMFGENDAM